MARIFLLVVLLVTVQAAHNKHHPKFPKFEDYETAQFRKVACSSENERIRYDLVQKAKCGVPREVFEQLKPQTAQQEITPGAVWVKRCVGICSDGEKCTPLKKQTRFIPVRIWDSKARKEMCVTYEIEEHLTCGCCPSGSTPEQCAAPRVFDPRKCACRCPNRKEKRNCRSKLNQIMRWNPSKCICEEKKRIR